MIETENSRSQKYGKWGFSNYSGLDHIMTSEGVSRLFSSISFHDSDAFLKKYFRYYKDSGISTRDLVIAFDSTNISTSSDGIETAEFGHAKKKENLPIVSTAMGVDEETGILLYYEDFIGSLLDKTQIEATRKKIKEIGFLGLLFLSPFGFPAWYCRISLLCMTSLKNNGIDNILDLFLLFLIEYDGNGEHVVFL